MSDLFHEKIPLEFIRKVFETMAETPQHTYQVLTKRSERLKKVAGALPWAENIWMGVSIEDKRVIHRLDDLKFVPASVRFLSLEPLLGPLDDLNLSGVDWVIVGGESGPKARPVKSEWVESIQEQCEDAGVEFFFKQWGGVRKHTTGRTLFGRTFDNMAFAGRRSFDAPLNPLVQIALP
jgi:protein gp37